MTPQKGKCPDYGAVVETTITLDKGDSFYTRMKTLAMVLQMEIEKEAESYQPRNGGTSK